jgi:hypothetical protein
MVLVDGEKAVLSDGELHGNLEIAWERSATTEATLDRLDRGLNLDSRLNLDAAADGKRLTIIRLHREADANLLRFLFQTENRLGDLNDRNAIGDFRATWNLNRLDVHGLQRDDSANEYGVGLGQPICRHQHRARHGDPVRSKLDLNLGRLGLNLNLLHLNFLRLSRLGLDLNFHLGERAVG